MLAIETQSARKNAERYIEEIRADDAELAALDLTDPRSGDACRPSYVRLSLSGGTGETPYRHAPHPPDGAVHRLSVMIASR
jgi:hypothetical protein